MTAVGKTSFTKYVREGERFLQIVDGGMAYRVQILSFINLLGGVGTLYLLALAACTIKVDKLLASDPKVITSLINHLRIPNLGIASIMLCFPCLELFKPRTRLWKADCKPDHSPAQIPSRIFHPPHPISCRESYKDLSAFHPGHWWLYRKSVNLGLPTTKTIGCMGTSFLLYCANSSGHISSSFQSDLSQAWNTPRCPPRFSWFSP